MVSPLHPRAMDVVAHLHPDVPMRTSILALVVTAGLFGAAPTFAQATSTICTDGTTSAPARRSNNNAPTGALAQVRHGMYPHSDNRRGACSRHQGVAKWMP